MWDSVFATLEFSNITMSLIRHNILDIRRQKGMVVQHISLPKLKPFTAYEENLVKMKHKLLVLEAWQDLEDFQ